MRHRRILLAATLLILVVAVRPVSGAGIYEERVRIAIEKYVKKHGLRFVPSDTAPLDEVRRISAEIDAGRDGRQSDASALTGTFTSLLDQPSTTNFLALALQSGAFQEERQSDVVTLTGSLYAVKRFVSPTPWRSMEEYAADRNLRRLSGSLSFGEVTANEAAIERDVRSWTIRYTFGSRDLRDFYRDPAFGPMAALHREILNVLGKALAGC